MRVHGGWGAVAVLLCGCLGAVGSGEVVRASLAFQAPPAIRPGWLLLETPDFTLHTDLPPDQAERAALLVSQSLAGLRAMFGRAPVLVPMRLELYALRDGLDFERRFGRMTWGFTSWGSGSLDQAQGSVARVCLYGPPDRWFVRPTVREEERSSVLVHELAHVILARYFPRQPLWFSEGMAQYLDTFVWIDAETVRFGDPNLFAYRAYREVRSLTVEDMLAWKNIGQREQVVAGLYGLTWAFIHFALNRAPADLERYMVTLARAGPEQAWAATFGPRGGLDEAVYAYMRVGEYRARAVRAPLGPPAQVAVRAATPEQDREREEVLAELERGFSAHRGK
jgi:hypothetical protein